MAPEVEDGVLQSHGLRVSVTILDQNVKELMFLLSLLPCETSGSLRLPFHSAHWISGEAPRGCQGAPAAQRSQ